MVGILPAAPAPVAATLSYRRWCCSDAADAAAVPDASAVGGDDQGAGRMDLDDRHPGPRRDGDAAVDAEGAERLGPAAVRHADLPQPAGGDRGGDDGADADQRVRPGGR